MIKNIVCDFCKSEFLITSVDIKTSLVDNLKKQGISIQYFKCPHCDYLYLISVIDKRYEWHLSRVRNSISRYKIKPSKSNLSKVLKNKESLSTYLRDMRGRFPGEFTLEQNKEIIIYHE